MLYKTDVHKKARHVYYCLALSRGKMHRAVRAKNVCGQKGGYATDAAEREQRLLAGYAEPRGGKPKVSAVEEIARECTQTYMTAGISEVKAA